MDHGFLCTVEDCFGAAVEIRYYTPDNQRHILFLQYLHLDYISYKRHTGSM